MGLLFLVMVVWAPSCFRVFSVSFLRFWVGFQIVVWLRVRVVIFHWCCLLCIVAARASSMSSAWAPIIRMGMGFWFVAMVWGVLGRLLFFENWGCGLLFVSILLCCLLGRWCKRGRSWFLGLGVLFGGLGICLGGSCRLS